MKQKITRRQKDVSRLLREKKTLQGDVLRYSKINVPRGLMKKLGPLGINFCEAKIKEAKNEQ